ncbi:MAG TPA: VOC family protein [Vicinamibacterales bacterium]|nr:VOC family protein [Vicinamibacterales bacterium]
MPLPADARIGRVSLTVQSRDRSMSFYQDVLGFTGVEGGLAPPGGRQLIELHERRDAVPRPARRAGLFHFAILVPSRAALGRSLRRLAEMRWPLTGAADHLVSEAVYLNDPDGLGIEIYRDRSRDTWRYHNGELTMATDPLDVQAIADEPGADAPWIGLDPATVIGHVHLHVPHLHTAEAFYCGEIGFEATVRRYPGALFVAAGGYHHHLGLNTWAGAGAPPPPENAVGLRSFTVESGQLQPRAVDDVATGVLVSLVST